MALVRVRGPLKQLAGDRSEHAIEGGSVGELLAELERTHPAAKGWILDERGVLRRHINVFVNGELGGQDTQVGRDDEVDVLPAISGGSLPGMLASVDGTIGPAEEARIPVTDEGLTRGDGGFEVMRLYEGRRSRSPTTSRGSAAPAPACACPTTTRRCGRRSPRCSSRRARSTPCCAWC